jgi:hypothetical protein
MDEKGHLGVIGSILQRPNSAGANGSQPLSLSISVTLPLEGSHEQLNIPLFGEVV